jgi:hypothetical protein
MAAGVAMFALGLIMLAAAILLFVAFKYGYI